MGGMQDTGNAVLLSIRQMAAYDGGSGEGKLCNRCSRFGEAL
jgi:hypothetical protein